MLRKLNQDPEQLHQYDAVICDQLRQGIVEVVPDPTVFEEGQVHYLPHHAVVRHDKQTTKLRVVYDIPTRTDGPSLNDCLYTGPNFGQSILDMLGWFRLHKVALVGDVEKAFLMVSVTDRDRCFVVPVDQGCKERIHSQRLQSCDQFEWCSGSLLSLSC